MLMFQLGSNTFPNFLHRLIVIIIIVIIFLISSSKLAILLKIVPYTREREKTVLFLQSVSPIYTDSYFHLLYLD